jgi:hypothetical protein
MQGRRVELIPQEGGFQALQPGEYGKWITGEWYACTPNDEGCNLSFHQVTEHEDRTITVTPSILVSSGTRERGNYTELWHGYLQRGVWTPC